MYNPKKEEEILRFWQENKIFQKSLEKNKGKETFVFYDGPPFATGLPHYGHVLPTTLKDIMPRYQTMRGKYVPRVWGWDCHGLPIENLVEKKLNLKNKKEIEEYGVREFNKESRNSVLTFADDWAKIIPRLGRWIDMDNAYLTMNPSFTESVWWSFKTLYDKNLAYEGFQSMHLCPHCETVLSNFEVGQGYKDITDLSVYVLFQLKETEKVSSEAPAKLYKAPLHQDYAGQTKTYVLVWTTTPWTLPGNVALAVNNDVDYVKVKSNGKILILGKERLEALNKILDPYEILEEIKGKDLIGLSYEPIFDYYSLQEGLKNKENGWKVYGADFVTTTEGTGVVHIAPAFGQDDQNLGMKENLPFVQHVATDGTFKEEVRDFAGMPVKPKGEKTNDHQVTDIEIIKYLSGNNVLFAKEKILHSYPHCWRCGTPLLNYTASSWFIKVTEFKDKLVEENKKVRWTPEHIGVGRFGKWLENAHDWSISRSRYWGAPLPIWKSPDGKSIEVIGSLDELKSKIKRNNYIALRHGEAEHNVSEVMNSNDNVSDPLTEAGKIKAKEAALSLKEENIDVIYASPLMRTKATAEIVRESLNFSGEIIFDERIREENFGDIEGKSITEYVNFYKDHNGMEARLSEPLPNGESLLDVKKRVTEFLYEVDRKNQGKNILIITHDGIIKMLDAVSRGGAKEDMLSIWSHFYYGVAPAEIKKINFAQLPLNELGELDLHRPYIDEIVWTNQNGEEMRRINDVFDTWYDSGSMPFASKHFPFNQKSNLQDTRGLTSEAPEYFPADFISEGVDQTRGWFYSLMVLGVGLFDKTPYKQVVVNGTILAEDGRKMSKSLNNYPPLMPTVEKYGADSLRYFLASSPAVKAEDMNFSEKGLDEVVKKHFNRLYNILSLFDLYKDGVADWRAYIKTTHPLDLWISGRLHQMRDEITEHLNNHEYDKATRQVGDLIEDFSTWYIRRSRERFKNEEDVVDRDKAISTTRYILLEFSKLMAPFIPFIAEDIYQRLGANTSKEESVHLEDWPEYKLNEEHKIQEDLILKQMEEVRGVVTLGLEFRAKANIKVRQPLSRLMLREDKYGLSDNEEMLNLIKDELNVKEVIFDAEIIEPAVLDTEITPELRKEGIARDLIRMIQDARKEKGLQPGDEVEVLISGTTDVHHIASEYKEMISKVTSVKSFLFEESGIELKVKII
jgi:isoleucyl-tRNA synthetase